ncbi:MAG: hypothetical protein NDJ89_13145 [Oligoflexia bacterium]|nr:hypothetical protein [Oligoflexia bacterium]
MKRLKVIASLLLLLSTVNLFASPGEIPGEDEGARAAYSQAADPCPCEDGDGDCSSDREACQSCQSCHGAFMLTRAAGVSVLLSFQTRVARTEPLLQSEKLSDLLRPPSA